MAWNPLTLKRTSTIMRPSGAPPLLSPAEDRQLDLIVQRLIYAESTIKKLTKEMKKYIEALLNLDRADQRLSTNLTSCGLAQNNDEFRKIAEQYISITTQKGKNIEEKISLCQKTFIEPLKKLKREFATVVVALTKREDLVTTWKYAFVSLMKLEDTKKKDRTGNYIVKLESQRSLEEEAAKNLKSIHTQLLVELPMFLEKRLEYINPSLQALITIQLNYYGHATQLYTEFMPTEYFSEFVSNTIIPEEEYQQNVNIELNRLRALTIVRDT